MILLHEALKCPSLLPIPKLIRLTARSKHYHYSEKTPIQRIGSDYLKRQSITGRPLSPHLTIYKPQLTWVLSGFHRISGCVMTGALAVGVLGFVILPFDFVNFVENVRSYNIPWIILDLMKFVTVYVISFHTLNGIRHLGFDMAKGIELISVYRSGWFVVAISALISFLVVANARITYGGKHPDTISKDSAAKH